MALSAKSNVSERTLGVLEGGKWKIPIRIPRPVTNAEETEESSLWHSKSLLHV